MKNKKVAVIGYGLEGRDLVRFLTRKGFVVSVLDRKEKKELDIADNSNISFVTGKDYLSSDLNKFETIYRSPGVYRYKRKLIDAERNGVKISSSTQLFFDKCPGNIIAVTGTKGKGTTCSLIFEILKKGGKDVFLAGNIGAPFLEILPKIKKDSWVVLELSSFQLIDLTKSPHIAVVLNITEDHLDWHKDIKEYIEAKKNILKFQKKEDFAVINADYKVLDGFKKMAKGKLLLTSIKKVTNGSFVKNNKIFLNVDNCKKEMGEVDKLILRGKHNWENITAAIVASHLAKVDTKTIQKTVFEFKGLEHRLEFVKTIKDVTFYNDSFATGPQPTIAAIKSFSEPITLILGGYDKGLSYYGLIDEISKAENIENIILIGDLESKLEKLLVSVKFKGKIITLGKSNMQDIVKKAYQVSKKGEIILLSPAAASFDMFNNYKERGNIFKEAVLKI